MLAALRGLCQEISKGQSSLTRPNPEDSKRLIVPLVALLERTYDVSSRYIKKVCRDLCGLHTRGTRLKVKATFW